MTRVDFASVGENTSVELAILDAPAPVGILPLAQGHLHKDDGWM
jgi:hypothetical protein